MEEALLVFEVLVLLFILGVAVSVLCHDCHLYEDD